MGPRVFAREQFCPSKWGTADLSASSCCLLLLQAVEAPTLSIMVPLLVRGLRHDNTTAIKRKASLIIENMAKLVSPPPPLLWAPAHRDVHGCDSPPDRQQGLLSVGRCCVAPRVAQPLGLGQQ